MQGEREDGMGVDDYRDRQGDAEARTGLGSDPAGVDDDFTSVGSTVGEGPGMSAATGHDHS